MPIETPEDPVDAGGDIRGPDAVDQPLAPAPRPPRPAPRKKRSPARKPAASAQAVSEPEVVEPEVVEPEVVEPEPEVVEPVVVEPVVGEPEPEPEVVVPEVVEPEPEVVEPEVSAPEVSAPEVIAASDAPTAVLVPDVEIVETAPDPDPVIAPEPASEDVAVDAIAVDAGSSVLSGVGADADAPAVRLRGVAKSFGETRAVDAIDLSIPAGTFYGIVGPNGAGKTTTLSMIAGLLRPDRGTIEVAGVDLAGDPARAKRMMGILPDRLRTFDRLTGRQLLHYYGVLRGLAPAVVESRAADLARAFDLSAALGRTVADYSAGMTKKVMLAGAMIHSPRVLVLDEPFEAVDPVSSAIILDILKAYVAHGGTVVLSSHGMDLVERVCEGVAVVVAGQVLAEGSVDEVRGELTLEQRFIELAGGLSDVEGLEWLHTFSG